MYYSDEEYYYEKQQNEEYKYNEYDNQLLFDKELDDFKKIFEKAEEMIDISFFNKNLLKNCDYIDLFFKKSSKEFNISDELNNQNYKLKKLDNIKINFDFNILKNFNNNINNENKSIKYDFIKQKKISKKDKLKRKRLNEEKQRKKITKYTENILLRYL